MISYLILPLKKSFFIAIFKSSEVTSKWPYKLNEFFAILCDEESERPPEW